MKAYELLPSAGKQSPLDVATAHLATQRAAEFFPGGGPTSAPFTHAPSKSSELPLSVAPASTARSDGHRPCRGAEGKTQSGCGCRAANTEGKCSCAAAKGQAGGCACKTASTKGTCSSPTARPAAGCRATTPDLQGSVALLASLSIGSRVAVRNAPLNDVLAVAPPTTLPPSGTGISAAISGALLNQPNILPGRVHRIEPRPPTVWPDLLQTFPAPPNRQINCSCDALRAAFMFAHERGWRDSQPQTYRALSCAANHLCQGSATAANSSEISGYPIE